MRYSPKEYILYINLWLVSKILMLFPLRVVIFFGKVLGTIAFYIDKRHKDIAYKNLRLALAGEKTIPELKRILKRNFQNFGMNLVEILMVPKIDKNYVDRYIEIEGRQNLEAAIRQKKGIILLGIHMGNWEIYFTIVGILGYPLSILVEEQIRNPLLDKFLNQLRQSKGVKVLKANTQMREILELLKENKIIGLVADHGIKEGISVDFFGRKTRTPTLAIRLALRFDMPLLPCCIRREKGMRHQFVIAPALDLKKTADLDKDIAYNLTTINKIFEEYIRQYPCEYLWSYKRFKYNQDREILLLTDGKAGHLRQMEACLKLIQDLAREKNLEIKVKQIKVEFKNRLSKALQSLSVGLARKSCCRGCLWCLKKFLTKESFSTLTSSYADIVVSCGSSLSGVNFVISAENQAKSVVIMRPGFLSTKRFNLAIIPRHDYPAKRKNVVVTDGALNIIDEEYLKEKSLRLKSQIKIQKELILGLLIGGNSLNFHLDFELISVLIKQIKSFLESQDAEILITTSRRTPKNIEELLKKEFFDYPRCPLLVIANEKNIPDAVAGISGLSEILIVSPESISMISEAASSGRYVVVFRQEEGLKERHRRFLDYLTQHGYIYLKAVNQIHSLLEEIFLKKPAVNILEDRLKVRKALERLL